MPVLSHLFVFNLYLFIIVFVLFEFMVIHNKIPIKLTVLLKYKIATLSLCGGDIIFVYIYYACNHHLLDGLTKNIALR